MEDRQCIMGMKFMKKQSSSYVYTLLQIEEKKVQWATV